MRATSFVLLPLWDKVAAKPTDEGSRGTIRVRHPQTRRETARPLIRPAGRATFSRKGRREGVV
jgi:hypothetical protein